MIGVEREPRQLIVAAGLIVATAIIQTIAVLMLEDVVWLWREQLAEKNSRPRLMAFVCSVIVYLFMLHIAEISIWAALFLRVAHYPTFAVALYESGLAFTTLDVPQLPPAWKFLGPAEGIAGLLMFAWSTTVMFNHTHWISEARRRYLRQRH